MKKCFLLLLLVSTSIYCQQKGLLADNAMVVSAREEAADINFNLIYLL